MAAGCVLRWQVWLADSEPPIWRRFQVSDASTLDDFHEVLQQVMGWQDLQPYQFALQGDRYALPSASIQGSQDSTAVTLASLNIVLDTRLTYTYDFKSGWLHLLTLEAIFSLEATLPVPYCLDGERACPPEGCGGIWGYESLLEQLGDPEDPDYEDLLERVGADFAPEAFDAAHVNRRLQTG